jgi:hypothetical protein
MNLPDKKPLLLDALTWVTRQHLLQQKINAIQGAWMAKNPEKVSAAISDCIVELTDIACDLGIEDVIKKDLLEKLELKKITERS